MVYHDSSDRGYGKSKEATKHPECTSDDNHWITCGTEENKLIKKHNAVYQLAAKCSDIVKHKEIISVIDGHRDLLMTLSDCFDI